MKRIAASVLSLCCLVAVGGCAKDLVTGKKTLNFYNLSDEPKIGSYVLLTQTKEMKAKGKKMDADADAAAHERIKGIVAKIAPVSHHTDFPYEAHLADVDVVNAWCAPGGKIMVYTGLWDPEKGLVSKASDDEIAAVLAHEIAHANARHVTEAISRSMTAMLVGAAVQSAISAGGSSRGADLFGRVFADGMNIYLPSYSRKNESEADRIGLFYMARAGYDPRTAVALWKRAAAKKKDHTSIFASHPASGERAQALEAILPETIAIYEEARAR